MSDDRFAHPDEQPPLEHDRDRWRRERAVRPKRRWDGKVIVPAEEIEAFAKQLERKQRPIQKPPESAHVDLPGGHFGNDNEETAEP